MPAAVDQILSPVARVGGDPIRAFQTWLDAALQSVVLGQHTGAWTLLYVRQAGDCARLRSQLLLERSNLGATADRIPQLQSLAIAELQGICEATSQQAVRALGNGLLTRQTPAAIARSIQSVIDSVGKSRSDLLVSFFVVRAHSAVTLDCFRAAGLLTVGVVAERVGPSATPSLRGGLTRDALGTSNKFKKNLVEVLTAGDDDVCPVCEQISEDGPYTLDEAEGLLPAHPRCRCAYLPWGDARFASVRDYDPDEQRDDRGRWSGVQHLRSWTPPQSDVEWQSVQGQNHHIHEPPLPELKTLYRTNSKGEKVVAGKQRLSSGVIMREADGRTWLVRPTNGHGGYRYTFPKGGVEAGLHPQANAIKETYEESGLKARIVGYAGDYQGDTSVTRMYHAVREDGHPKDHGWETESVTLVHPSEIGKYLNRSRDLKIAKHHLGDEFNEELHPRDKDGKFASGSGGASEHVDKLKSILQHAGIPYDHDQDTAAFGGHIISVAHHDAPSVKALAESNHVPIFSEMKGTKTHFNIPEKAYPQYAMPSASLYVPIDMGIMSKIGAQKGSNEGGVYQHPTTENKYYIKHPATKDHVENELLAAALYKAAGVGTMTYVPVVGGAHVATKLQTLDKNNVKQFTPAERAEAQRDFAVHAWLANWDAAGTGGDNQVIVGGKVTTVDTGGSLRYRAQGEPKGAAFGDKVTEIDSLRDPSKSPDAAALYGSMTNEQIKESIARVTSLDNQTISSAVYANTPSATPLEKSQLVDKLIARKNDLAAQAEKMTTAAAWQSHIAKSAVPASLSSQVAASGAGFQQFGAAPTAKTSHDYLLHVQGNSKERIAWRDQLKTTTDPTLRKELQSKILASFAKHHASTKSLEKKQDIAAKATKYAKQYGVLNPIVDKKPAAVAAAPAPPAIPEEHETESMSEEELAKQMLNVATKGQADSYMKNSAYGSKHDLTPIDVGFIRAYCGSFYGKENEQLRDGLLNEKVYHYKEFLNHALEKLPVYQEKMIYRKITKNDDFMAKFYNDPNNRVVTWNAFSSCAKDKNKWSGNWRFDILHKTGRDVEPISQHGSNEAEVLIPAGVHMKVLNFDAKSRVIQLQELAPFVKKKKAAA